MRTNGCKTLTDLSSGNCLRKLFNQFKGYGDYALLLTVLSYNVGPANILGGGKYKPSKLIQKIQQGRKDIEQDYIGFCRWKGKVIPSIKQRRGIEFQYLVIYH